MPPICVPGRLAKLKVAESTSDPFVVFGGIVDISMPINVDELECTTHDSNGAREYIPNHHDVTMDITGRWKDGDPGQEIVLQKVFDKTSFQFQYTMESVAGRKLFEGSAFATTTTPAGPLDDTGGLDVTLRCSGVVMKVQT